MNKDKHESLNKDFFFFSILCVRAAQICVYVHLCVYVSECVCVYV